MYSPNSSSSLERGEVTRRRRFSLTMGQSRMRELVADLWHVGAELHVITTNGSIGRSGRAIMGRGCACEAKLRFPGLDIALGAHLRGCGNVVWLAPASITPRYRVATLPVKAHWQMDADIRLIQASVTALVDLVDRLGLTSVAMPRPGCGNGGLSWNVVRPILDDVLDRRFVVVGYPTTHPDRSRAWRATTESDGPEAA